MTVVNIVMNYYLIPVCSGVQNEIETRHCEEGDPNKKGTLCLSCFMETTCSIVFFSSGIPVRSVYLSFNFLLFLGFSRII